VARTPFLHPFAKPANEHWITIVRGEGAHVWDDDGNRYIDGMASLWYCQIGHGRPEVAEAVARQMRAIEAYHTFDIFTNEAAERFCELVVGLAPIDGRVFLTCSGSEAVDTAIKLARLHFHLQGQSHRNLIVGRNLAYHGTAYGGMSAQGLPLNQEGYGPLLDGMVRVPHDDLTEAETLFAEHGERIAAVLAEPVIGAGGVYPPEPGYLAELRRLCDGVGALLILDEVICGFGRLGSWFGAERYDVEPDLLTFAKGATSGYLPVGGVLVGRRTLEVLEADPGYLLRTGFTYSGHPTACAAGVANIEILQGEDLPGRAAPMGRRLRAGFDELLAEELVAEVRGDGAVFGVGMLDGVDAVAVRDAMLRRGVIARPIGATTIAWCPPLVTSDTDLDTCVEVFGEALREVRTGS
jgi:adenosylmethionine-8-amino-7-oxononanoate aminotransferase